MFNNLMSDDILITRATSCNKYAEYSYININAKCRLEWSDKIIRDDTGSNVVSVAVLYCITELKRNDKITYQGIEFRIEKVVQLKDIGNRVQHYVGYLI